jgi:molybdate/tungstate transport system substrate-binding protein
MRNILRIMTTLFFGLWLALSTAARAADPELSGNVTILQAASLADLFKKAQAEFTSQQPKVTIQIQPGASGALIRQITDLDKEADIIAVADRTLVPKFLMPKYVDWSIDFLTEQMVIIVGENAKHAGEITAANWPQILLNPDVEYGISDPQTAPVGYRSLMVWQLAEQYYKQPKLYEQLQTRLSKKNIRPNATALVTLLKNGELDYIFDYASLAKQQGLRTVVLPGEINLGNPQFADRYGTVSATIPGKEPGTTTQIKGEPIVYSIAVLKNAKNPKAAQAFVNFLVGPRGRQLMAEGGMTPLVPAQVAGTNMPDVLKSTLLQR